MIIAMALCTAFYVEEDDEGSFFDLASCSALASTVASQVIRGALLLSRRGPAATQVLRVVQCHYIIVLVQHLLQLVREREREQQGGVAHMLSFGSAKVALYGGHASFSWSSTSACSA
jgi:hypothetical protein